MFTHSFQSRALRESAWGTRSLNVRFVLMNSNTNSRSEPWITPSIFQPWENGGGVVDEYTFTAALGKDAAQSQLNQHWGSWITEADFQEIASIGLNHVRIPIGYWALAPVDGDPYVQGQLPYLDNAIKWARGAGIKVMLDVHGGKHYNSSFPKDVELVVNVSQCVGHSNFGSCPSWARAMLTNPSTRFPKRFRQQR